MVVSHIIGVPQETAWKMLIQTPCPWAGERRRER